MRGFKSINHDVYTYEVEKAGLSSIDDKRYVLDNGIDTLAFGHYSIVEKNEID